MMKKILLLSIILCCNLTSYTQENAAPSMHLYYDFPSKDAVLKMQKIKIVNSAPTSFFAVNHFTNGYTGLQQTPDKRHAHPNILIFSLWDKNTAKKIYSNVEYINKQTDSSRFGGEGDGYKTINPYGWKLNQWYNIATRAWKKDKKLYIATFICDESTQKWLHTATLSIPDTSVYLESYNDAFLENWTGVKPENDGRHKRKAFFKDLWNLTPEGKWEKVSATICSVNDSKHDQRRNGKYHNSFNAYYDATENAYCMEHGADVKPSAAFNNKREAKLPLLKYHSDAPTLGKVNVNNLKASYANEKLSVTWDIPETSTPQLSYEILITDGKTKKIQKISNTKPETRKVNAKIILPKGRHSIKLIITDIFEQSIETTTTLKV